MDNIKVDHIARTVYDRKEDLGNKPHLNNGSLVQSFLNDVKPNLFEDNYENFIVNSGVKTSSQSTINYEKTYDLKRTAVNHLSYLDEVQSLKLPENRLTATKYLKNYTDLQQSDGKNLTKSKLNNIDKENLRVDTFYSSNFDPEVGSTRKNSPEVKQISGVCPNFFKKNILITKSELFIRNLGDDQVELLENIRRQLPANIDRIWVNGKIIWSKI
ncbi:hypothetical protein [Acinetobacter sp. 3657]|uniref:hypothetical protein n=1 Tax=Acinetobacter sp. 3657 TaxID=2817764 RepID=UPI002863B104|nr:hypothetical protein [Prolinoborus sp. 3657]